MGTHEFHKKTKKLSSICYVGNIVRETGERGETNERKHSSRISSSQSYL